MSANLVDGLFEEMNRVRDMISYFERLKILFVQKLITSMEQDIINAENAMRDCDPIKMLECYKKLKEYEN